MTVPGMPPVAGVLGWPVAHSRSPRLMGYWLHAYGIRGMYVPFAVPPDRLELFLPALAAQGMRGCNITLPHKEAALALADEVDATARSIGAVNTIVATDDARLRATNTDAFGFLENLGQCAPAWPRDRPSVVLGAGGASRAVVFALLDAGVPELRLVNRTMERAQALAGDFGARVTPVAWKEREDALDGAGLLVNTTQLGMTGQPELDIVLDRLAGDAVVCDLVYNPLETDLLRRARACRLVTVDGLGMLLHQARPGFAAWFGREPEVDDAVRAFVAEGL